MNQNKGFTLLELLVVVLIIGILAAVALPQYKKAVIKSKAAEAIINLKAIDQAQQRYFMVHGTYTTSLNELDIDIQNSKLYTYSCTIVSQKSDCHAHYINTYPSFELYNDILFCRGTTKDCKPFNPTVHPNWPGYWIIKPGSF